MLKDSSWPGSRSSSLRLEKALAIILLFLILLGWSSLCPVSLGTRRGTEGTWGAQVSQLGAQGPSPSPPPVLDGDQGWRMGPLGMEVSHKWERPPHS